MKTAVISLSNEGRAAGHPVGRRVAGLRRVAARRRQRDAAGAAIRPCRAAFAGDLSGIRGLVYVVPVGVAVRAIAPLIRHKTTDPAVVAVNVGGRWAVSLLSGHEGGANQLAIEWPTSWAPNR